MLKVYKQNLGDTTILYLQGRLVTGETENLREAVISISDATTVVLDLRRVSRIDARGLGLLLQLREHTMSKGLKFRLANVTSLVQQVFEIACLSSVFEISSERSLGNVGIHGRASPELEEARCA